MSEEKKIQENKVMEFDIERQHIPIKLSYVDDVNGAKTKIFIDCELVEMDGDGLSKWEDFRSKCIVRDKDGVVTEIKNKELFNAMLIHSCLVYLPPVTKTFSVEEISRFSSTTLNKLWVLCSEINGLNLTIEEITGQKKT